MKALAVAPDGSLWVGTWGNDVFRYDGTKFERFRIPDKWDNRIESMAFDRDGNLLVGIYFGDILQFDGKSWDSFGKRTGLNQGYAEAVATDSKGNVWVATETGTGGLARYDGNAWKAVTLFDYNVLANYVYALKADLNGNVWFGTDYGVVGRFDGQTFQQWTVKKDGLADASVQAIAIDQKGNIWAGTDGGGVDFYDGRSWQVLTTKNSGLASNSITAVAVDLKGNVWIGTEEGLSRYDGQSWQTFNKDNGLLDKEATSWWPSVKVDSVSSIAIDRSGSVWVGIDVDIDGSNVHGLLSRFDGRNWLTFSPINTRPSFGEALALDANGNPWTGNGSYMGGASHFDGTVWHQYGQQISVYGQEVDVVGFEKGVGAIFVDSKGNTWVGTKGEKGGWVTRYDGQSWQTFTTKNSGLANDSVLAISGDRKGNIWFGTGDGVSVFDGQSWKSYTSENSGLLSYSVPAIAVDLQGNVWFSNPMGGVGGVTKFDGSTWVTYLAEKARWTDAQIGYYEEHNHNLQRSGLAGKYVTSIAVDSTGNLWFGTEEGISKFDGHAWMNYTKQNSGLPDDDVTSLVFDKTGVLWVGTVTAGVACFDGKSWWQYPFLRKTFVGPIALDRIGRIWITTTYSLVYYSP